MRLKKLPDEIPQTPYEATAFRVHHYHVDEGEPGAPGTLVLEIAANLPGTEAELVVPFEMTTDTVVGLIDELLHQYRCVTYGLPDEEEDAEE